MQRTVLTVCAAVSLFAAIAWYVWQQDSTPFRASGQLTDLTARALLDRAHEDLLHGDVKQYAATLSAAVAATGTPLENARAQAEYANYLWRIRGDVPRARRTLSDAGDRFPAPLLERAQLELFAGDFAASRSAALLALNVSHETADRRLANTAFARAVMAQATDAAIQPRQPDAELDSLMRQSLTMLRPYVDDEPGLREPSRYALLAALWCGDRATAFRAWQSYYRLGSESEALPPLADAAKTLRELLASISDDSPDIQIKIAEALSASRLFPEAAALSAHWKLSDSATRDVVEYVRWTCDLSRDFNESYRQIALGKKVASGRERLDRSASALWHKLHDPRAEYNFDAFIADVGNRFGAVIHTVPDGANYGHVIKDKIMNVEQYGHKAQLRSVVLDSMVSNGYTTWLWDGRAQIGGWSSDAGSSRPATIVSIRHDGALTAWAAMTDPEVTQRSEENLQRWRKEDDERARQDPYAYLPGLRLRMFLAGARRVYDRPAAKGLKGSELRTAFLTDYERLQEASSITAHEGRHALDKQSRELSLGLRLLFRANEELEYRAKLSEVAFAPEPLLAMNAIFNSDIGAKGSAHGMANLRIMKGLVAWMKLHSGEIKGLDSSRPLLPQFDLLSDEQMKAAFRSMDPWAT